MTQIRASMQQKLNQDKIDEDASKFRNINIAPPVNENENNIDLNISDDESLDESIDIDIDLNSTFNVQKSDWKNQVLRWINMLENESNEEENNENNFNNNDSDSDSNDEELEISAANISNLPHPARDKSAKWKLQDIFISNLGEPSYLSSFMLGNV